MKAEPNGDRLVEETRMIDTQAADAVDIFGKEMEWCHDRHRAHPWPCSGVEPDPAVTSLSIGNQDAMATRGGAGLFQPLHARAAYRDKHHAETSRVYLSLRIARTVRNR